MTSDGYARLMLFMRDGAGASAVRDIRCLLDGARRAR